jgi:hypothetical protein
VAIHHYYRVTKYDPALRDDSGAYTGEDWTMFDDIGKSFDGVRLTLATYLEVEARHLVALASFLEENDTSGLTADGVENNGGGFRVVEGQRLSSVDAIECVRQVLRSEGWCRLSDDDRFYLHVGWDYYLHVGTDAPCDQSVELARKAGLFVDENFPSPYLD